VPLKQFHTDKVFQSDDLLAYRTLRDAQLLGGPREVLMSRSGVKSFDRI
jgi:hypothetical protein